MRCLLSSISPALFLCLLLPLARPQAATVTIDPSAVQQTIEGIGVFDGMPRLYQKAGNFYVDRPMSYEYDRLCMDLGASCVRFYDDGSCHPRAGVYDWTPMRGMLAVMRECIKRGTTRFLITALNPPGWMKSNGTAENGGNLLDANYDGFAAYMAQLCKQVKDSIGVEPYALSLQNEPSFPEPYGSCVYSDANLSRLVDLTAPKLQALGLTTRIIGPEDVTSNGGLNWPNMRNNANLYAYAGHGDCTWSSAASYVSGTGKKLWMTEWDIYSGAPSPILATDYLRTGNTIMGALTNSFTWFTWFGYAGNLGSTNKNASGVDTMYVPDKRYYATKHFARFVRPGAVRIGCAGSGATIAAFKNPDNSIGVIAINNGSATTIDLSGTGIPTSWHVYQTTATANCAYVGASNGAGIALPASSVTSVISGSKVPQPGADTIPYRVAEPAADNTVGLLNMRGDDSLQVWLNGAPISGNPIKKIVSVRQGENVIACRLKNTGWGGGLAGSMLLPGGDTLRTDGTWKVSYRNPGAGTAWTETGYDDSKWIGANVLGNLEVWPGFASFGSQAVNLYYQKAKWVYGANKTYFRVQVASPSAGSGSIAIRGNNFNYKVYVNGTLAGQGTGFAGCGSEFPFCLEKPNVTIPATFVAGANCIAWEIEDAATDVNGVLLKTSYRLPGAVRNVPLDTTSRCWYDSAPGWKNVGFIDTGWVHPDTINAYDPVAGIGKFIYPGTFWFRKQFTSKAATRIIRELGLTPGEDRVVSSRYFTLQGRLFAGDARSAALSRATMIRRNVYQSGNVEDVKVMRLR